MTKYYFLGDQRVAMRQGDEVYYLHGDHLGSVSLVTDSNGEVVSEARYTPYGRLRDGSIGPTDFGFTSQRQEMGFGLYDYNARFYSPMLGRFISPDTIIPNPINSQDFNRYTYVRNNPLRYVDPSGHANCGADDQACWESRWYRAHGYAQDGGKWVRGGEAQFDDPEILLDVLGEGGLQAVGEWYFHDLSVVGQAVVDFAWKIGSLGKLDELLGPDPVKLIHERRIGAGCWDRGGMGCAGENWIRYTLNLFPTASWADRPDHNYAKGAIVHELAHVIDSNSSFLQGTTQKIFSEVFPHGGGPITLYGEKNNVEYFSEAVTDWVYGNLYKPPNEYRGRNNLEALQVDFMDNLLKGR